MMPSGLAVGVSPSRPGKKEVVREGRLELPRAFAH